jgi:hypothetical protein
MEGACCSYEFIEKACQLVVPSEARNLLFRKFQRNSRFLVAFGFSE